MNELIITTIIAVLSLLVGVIFYGLRLIIPPTVNWIKSFIKFHKKNEVDEL